MNKSVKEIAEEAGYLISKDFLTTQPIFDGHFWLGGGIFEVTTHSGNAQQLDLLRRTFFKYGYGFTISPKIFSISFGGLNIFSYICIQ